MLVVAVVPGYHIYVGLLVNSLLSEACIVPSGTTKASLQGGGPLISPAQGRLALCSQCMVYSAMGTYLPSLEDKQGQSQKPIMF